MSPWIDATLPLANDSQVWPGDLPVRVRPTVQICKGDPCNELRIEMGSHSTTHIDAPRHFDESGPSIDQLPPDLLLGPAWVVESLEPRFVTVDDLKPIPDGEFTRVILKTRNTSFLGEGSFREDYVSLAESAARRLVERGCRLVGTDYYSICPFNDVLTTHRILLGNGVAIIESMLLKEVKAGPVDLIALPLKIVGGDASPARVFIRERTIAEGEARARS